MLVLTGPQPRSQAKAEQGQQALTQLLGRLLVRQYEELSNLLCGVRPLQFPTRELGFRGWLEPGSDLKRDAAEVRSVRPSRSIGLRPTTILDVPDDAPRRGGEVISGERSS
jgi:hypothetical protein